MFVYESIKQGITETHFGLFYGLVFSEVFFWFRVDVNEKPRNLVGSILLGNGYKHPALPLLLHYSWRAEGSFISKTKQMQNSEDYRTIVSYSLQ
jgi:hypothetical protein